MKRFDVAIVGCGPVGALAANLLGKQGVETLVIERDVAPFELPRAAHIDHEMMRLFQAAGLAQRLIPLMREAQGHLHIGADGGVIRYMGTAGRPRPFAFANDYFFFQPELDAALREGLCAHPNVELRIGWELGALRQGADGVSLQLRDAYGRSAQVSARYVIACDGARSTVRKQLGVELCDLGFDEPWLVVDADVHGPVHFPAFQGVPAEADLQQLSVMLCDPRRPSTVVPGRGTHRRWEFMLLPGEDERAMSEPQAIAALLEPFLGGVRYDLLRAATYRFHGLIAEHWRSGRVFLAGDAAHQSPPFFGQGMCHGMRDVANLAWKLPLVLSGRAGRELLDSYQPERAPHVRAVIETAVAAGRYICQLDPAEAEQRDRRMRDEAAQGQPSPATSLIPALTHGVVATGTPGAGERFVHPLVEPGLLPLDRITGGGMLLLARDAQLLEALSPKARALLQQSDARQWVFDGRQPREDGTLARWFDERGVRAVIVRPDFYVYGSAVDGPGLDALVRRLGRSLHLRPHHASPQELAP